MLLLFESWEHMFQVKLRYLDIYASNSFQRFPIPHVIWICVCAMSCVKKFNEHFNILNAILHQIHIFYTLGLDDGQKLPISSSGQREEMGTERNKPHLTRVWTSWGVKFVTVWTARAISQNVRNPIWNLTPSFQCLT